MVSNTSCLVFLIGSTCSFTTLRLQFVPHCRWPPFTPASFTADPPPPLRTALAPTSSPLPWVLSPFRFRNGIGYFVPRLPQPVPSLHSASSSCLTVVGPRSLLRRSLRDPPSAAAQRPSLLASSPPRVLPPLNFRNGIGYFVPRLPQPVPSLHSASSSCLTVVGLRSLLE